MKTLDFEQYQGSEEPWSPGVSVIVVVLCRYLHSLARIVQTAFKEYAAGLPLKDVPTTADGPAFLGRTAESTFGQDYAVHTVIHDQDRFSEAPLSLRRILAELQLGLLEAEALPEDAHVLGFLLGRLSSEVPAHRLSASSTTWSPMMMADS